jgi:subtilisin family serine protease
MSVNSDEEAFRPLKLKPRAIFPKPAKTTLEGATLHNVFVLKWTEGTHIRARNGIFVFDPSALSPSEQELLNRAQLDYNTIARELDLVNQLFSSDPELQFQPMFQRPEADLEKEKEEGKRESGEELADLNLYFYVMVKKIGFSETEKLIDQLNALTSVEIAYPQRIPFPAAMDIPPTTPDFRLVQSYLEPAPQGIDAFYAWAFRAGKGDFAQVIDIETGWHLNHEDLPDERALTHNHGWHWAYHDHGTAVLGILAAQDNGFGITGIVPRTALGVDSPVAAIPPYDVPGAINRAAAALPRGGIVLIEQHYPFGPSGSWVPVEDSQGDFDAIRNATARGIIVVEAAGNGGRDLNVPFFRGRFDRTVRDSGAILVGAGMPYTGQPEGFSNFGRRVDVHG